MVNKYVIGFIGIVIVAGVITSGYFYIKHLQSQLQIAEANINILTENIQLQQETLENQQREFKEIVDANREILETNRQLDNELRDLNDKFNKVKPSGRQRDIGFLAFMRPRSIERVIDAASLEALRCIEIASGAQLTAEELNATKKSNINSECTSIANPNYIPY